VKFSTYKVNIDSLQQKLMHV